MPQNDASNSSSPSQAVPSSSTNTSSSQSMKVETLPHQPKPATVPRRGAFFMHDERRQKGKQQPSAHSSSKQHSSPKHASNRSDRADLPPLSHPTAAAPEQGRWQHDLYNALEDSFKSDPMKRSRPKQQQRHHQKHKHTLSAPSPETQATPDGHPSHARRLSEASTAKLNRAVQDTMQKSVVLMKPKESELIESVSEELEVQQLVISEQALKPESNERVLNKVSTPLSSSSTQTESFSETTVPFSYPVPFMAPYMDERGTVYYPSPYYSAPLPPAPYYANPSVDSLLPLSPTSPPPSLYFAAPYGYLMDPFYSQTAVYSPAAEAVARVGRATPNVLQKGIRTSAAVEIRAPQKKQT